MCDCCNEKSDVIQINKILREVSKLYERSEFDCEEASKFVNYDNERTINFKGVVMNEINNDLSTHIEAWNKFHSIVDFVVPGVPRFHYLKIYTNELKIESFYAGHGLEAILFYKPTGELLAKIKFDEDRDISLSYYGKEIKAFSYTIDHIREKLEEYDSEYSD